MATLLRVNLPPKPRLSTKAVPAALHQALAFIFLGVTKDVWLVGGTALAGYYAEHRRSDDLDLFVANAEAFRSTVLAVKSLQSQGAVFSDERTSAFYYHVLVKYQVHEFTIDVVLDEALHRMGKGIRTDDGNWVAELNTLLAMKIATLVSRCSEKDLYDLDWLLAHCGDYALADFIELGAHVDAGVTIETLLISLQGSVLRRDACHFLLKNSAHGLDDAYRTITALKKTLLERLLAHEKKIPLSQSAESLCQAVRDFKKFQK